MAYLLFIVGVIEELKKAQTELESELKQSSEECQIARQQKDGLLKHTENLKIKILNLEEDFQSLQGIPIFKALNLKSGS